VKEPPGFAPGRLATSATITTNNNTDEQETSGKTIPYPDNKHNNNCGCETASCGGTEK
jgi:hypothetical protein